MSAKPPKPGFPNTQFEPNVVYPLYMSPHYDLHAPSPASLPDHFLTSRSKASDVQSGVPEGGGTGLSFAERFKRWSFEPERGISTSDLHSYSASPLLSANNDHQLLCSSAAAGHGEDIAGAVKEAHARASLLESSIGGGLNAAFLPLSSSSAPFPEGTYRTSTNKPQYCTAQADMEILRANEGQNVVSEPVHLFEDIPSSLTHQSADLSSASDYHLPYSNPTQRLHPFVSSLTTLHRSNSHESQLFSDHHQPWGPALRVSSAATNPHAELLLLPGISESVEEASNASGIPEAALSAGSTHDLLHVSSLHDKQGSAMALPLGVIGGTGRPPPHVDQFWNADKLDMTVGLGSHENPARRFIPQLPLTDADHHASMRCAVQSGLSLLLQPPLQRGHSTVLSFDPARYNARSASGSLGVLRNSKYLKAAQQLLNECCNVYRDGNGRTRRSSDASKGSSLSISYNNMRWSDRVGSDGCAAEGDVDDDDEKPGRSLFASGRSHYQNLQHRNDQNKDQQEKTSTGADHQPAAKQMPAEERCNLQMRKTRLIAMVEELDRRYQQYRDQMQLIVTSYESAAGMGGAAPYTTLARKAMSRQFRGLRDAIGEHISAVCRTLGEEVSSVPILSRGETPRLRLVDQQLRHQRSLQQIGMLPQQQAWRPQRGLPERSVSVLRAWLFEHFLHPYPKDSEKAMLARLTGLSRNQVSNWFINARVRLWKPMIEEMYIEEGKALQEEGAEGIINAGMDEIEHAEDQDGSNESFSHGVEMGVSNNMSGMHWMTAPAAEKQQESLMQNHFMPLRGQGLDQQVHLLLSGLHPTHHSAAHNELQSFIQFHSSARNATAMAGEAPPVLAPADCQSHPFSWMKLPTAAPPGAAHVGDIGNILSTGSTQLYDHSPHQLSSDSHSSALIQQQQQQHRQGPQLSSSGSNLYKNGVSLTLGLQQPPLHSAFNPNPSSASNPYHGRPSEALLF